MFGCTETNTSTLPFKLQQTILHSGTSKASIILALFVCEHSLCLLQGAVPTKLVPGSPQDLQMRRCLVPRQSLPNANRNQRPPSLYKAVTP
jgi:hypothetical protein